MSPSPEVHAPAHETPHSPAYANYVLGVLVLLYVINYVDRQILSVLIEPIKQDLGVSDTAMGLLSGIAFALFYTTAGIPIARLADRHWLRRLIGPLGLALHHHLFLFLLLLLLFFVCRPEDGSTARGILTQQAADPTCRIAVVTSPMR